jgi:hypothetical protein
MPLHLHRLSTPCILAALLGVWISALSQAQAQVQEQAPVTVSKPVAENAPATEVPATLKEADMSADAPPASEPEPDAEETDDETIPQAFPEDRYLTMWDKNPFLLKTAVIEQKTESFAKDWALSGISATGGVFTVRIFNKQTGKFERLKEGQDTGSEFKLVKVSYDKDRSKSKVEVMRGTEKAELTYDDSLMSRPVTVQNTMGATGAPGQAPGAAPTKPGQPINPNLPPGAQGNLQRGPNGQPLTGGAAALRPGMQGYVPGRPGGPGSPQGAVNTAPGMATTPGMPTNPNAINPATGAPIVNPATGGMPGAPIPGYATPGSNAGAQPPVSRRRQLIPAPIQQSQ